LIEMCAETLRQHLLRVYDLVEPGQCVGVVGRLGSRLQCDAIPSSARALCRREA